MHQAKGTSKGHDSLRPGGNRSPHGNVAEFLLLHIEHRGTQVLQTEFHAAFAFVEADGGPGDERGFLEEDFLFLAVLGRAHGHGVHEGGLTSNFRLVEERREQREGMGKYGNI